MADTAHLVHIHFVSLFSFIATSTQAGRGMVPSPVRHAVHDRQPHPT
jgi:hypothetical protein